MLTTARLFLLSAQEDATYADLLAQELARSSANSGQITVTKVSEPTLLAAVGVGTQPSDQVIAILSPAALNSAWLQSQVDIVVALHGQLRLLFCFAQPISTVSSSPGLLAHGLPIGSTNSILPPAEAASQIMGLQVDAPVTGPYAAAIQYAPLTTLPAAQNAATTPIYHTNTPPTQGYQGYYQAQPSLAPRRSIFNFWTFIAATSLTTLIIVALLFASGVFHLPNPSTPLATASTRTPIPTVTPSPSGTPIPTVTPLPTGTVVTPGQLLFTANWSSGLSGWSGAENWQIEGGALVSNCASKCTLLAPFNAGASTANYVVDADIAVVSINNSDGFFGPVARVQGDASQAQGYIGGPAGLNGSEISGIPQLSYIGGGTIGSPGAPIAVGNGTHDYRLEVRGSQISLFIDGNLESQVADYSFPSGGQIGLRASPDVQILVSNLTVTAV